MLKFYKFFHAEPRLLNNGSQRPFSDIFTGVVRDDCSLARGGIIPDFMTAFGMAVKNKARAPKFAYDINRSIGRKRRHISNGTGILMLNLWRGIWSASNSFGIGSLCSIWDSIIFRATSSAISKVSATVRPWAIRPCKTELVAKYPPSSNGSIDMGIRYSGILAPPRESYHMDMDGSRKKVAYKVVYKTISIAAVIMFATAAAWPAAGSVLRPQAALDRAGINTEQVLAHDEKLASLIKSFGTSELPLIVIGPHPDDIEEGTAGLQCMLTERGQNNIHWLILTTGADPSGVLDEQVVEGYEPLPAEETERKDELRRRKIKLREDETAKAAEMIGVPRENITFFQFGAGGRGEDFKLTMGPVQQKEFVSQLEKIAEGLPPSAPVAIAWHIQYDKHEAHTYSAAKFINPAIAEFIKRTDRPVYMVRFRLFNGIVKKEEPNLYLLMGLKTENRKTEALSCHKSQIERRTRTVDSEGRIRAEEEGTMIDQSREKEGKNLEFAREQFPEADLSNVERAERFRVVELRLPVRFDIDGELYNGAKADQTNRAESDRRLADLARLNIIAEREAQKLENIRARIKESPTDGNKEFFGLAAERLMLVLIQMQKIREWVLKGDLDAARQDIDWAYYESNITYSERHQANATTQYGLFAKDKLIPASAAVGRGLAKAKRTAQVLMAGGAGTRLQELYSMGAEARQEIGAGDLTDAELTNISKPTVPYSKITHKSPITVILESIRRIQQDTSHQDGEDEPLVIIVGPDTAGPILEALRKNNYFGIKRLVLKGQGTVPVYNAKGEVVNWGPVESEPGGRFVDSPDGGGGTVMALGDKGILVIENGVERTAEDKTVLGWLDENFPNIEGINFLQTDMALEQEAILGLAGARDETGANIAVMGFNYPARISVKTKKDSKGNITNIYVEEEFTLGTLFSEAAAPDSAAIIEYGERGDALNNLIYETRYGIQKAGLQERLNELAAREGGLNAVNSMSTNERNEALARLQAGVDKILLENMPNAINPNFTILANAGAYNVSRELTRKIVEQRLLKPHTQIQKDRQTKDGRRFKADNLELFITDMPQTLGRPCGALVDEGDALPAKDPKKFVESRNYYAKRHEKKLREEFGIAAMGNNAVVEISPLFRGSIDPGLKIGDNSGLYLGGSGIGKGFNIAIGKNVEIADNTTLIIIGNGPVVIEDGVKFSGGRIVIKSPRDEEITRIASETHMRGEETRPQTMDTEAASLALTAAQI